MTLKTSDLPLLNITKQINKDGRKNTTRELYAYQKTLLENFIQMAREMVIYFHPIELIIQHNGTSDSTVVHSENGIKAVLSVNASDSMYDTRQQMKFVFAAIIACSQTTEITQGAVDTDVWHVALEREWLARFSKITGVPSGTIQFMGYASIEAAEVDSEGTVVSWKLKLN